jgi:hypothetical protein
MQCPPVSQDYVVGQTSLHDGPITLADEQAQWHGVEDQARSE